jgi:hypothetical protein
MTVRAGIFPIFNVQFEITRGAGSGIRGVDVSLVSMKDAMTNLR